jgi:hypothetical protein
MGFTSRILGGGSLAGEISLWMAIIVVLSGLINGLPGLILCWRKGFSLMLVSVYLKGASCGSLPPQPRMKVLLLMIVIELWILTFR